MKYHVGKMEIATEEIISDEKLESYLRHGGAQMRSEGSSFSGESVSQAASGHLNQEMLEGKRNSFADAYNKHYEYWQSQHHVLAENSFRMLEPSTGADASSVLDSMLIANEQDFGMEQ